MTPDTEASDAVPGDEAFPDLPEWDDEYIDRVSHRLKFNYDLEREYHVRGESFTLYGALRMENRKQFFHPALSYGHHESEEYLFVRRNTTVSVAELERLVALGHTFADDIDADEEHFSTDFTFVVVVETLEDEVREFVAGFHDRTLLKYGYYGHYEVNLVVSAPDSEELVASQDADIAEAFRLWEPDEPDSRGLVARLAGLFG